MKERPILFNGEMVRAILEGRKTQTRRILKPQPSGGVWCHPTQGPMNGRDQALVCRHGQPGDRLWVREAWGLSGTEADVKPSEYHDPEEMLRPYLVHRATADGYDREVQSWRPSIHMPRWASRITLEITAVRVERLQDIDAAGATAEGVTLPRDAKGNLLIDVSSKFSPAKYTQGISATTENIMRAHFASLWESINGAGSWEANPWVWVVEFQRVDAQEAS